MYKYEILSFFVSHDARPDVNHMASRGWILDHAVSHRDGNEWAITYIFRKEVTDDR